MFTYRLHATDIFSLNRFNFICESCSVHRSCSLPLSGWEKCSRMPREIRFIRDNRDVFWAISEHSGRVCPLAVARDTMCSCRHIFCALLSHLCYYLELLEVDRDRSSASVREVTVVAMETLSDVVATKLTKTPVTKLVRQIYLPWRDLYRDILGQILTDFLMFWNWTMGMGQNV